MGRTPTISEAYEAYAAMNADTDTPYNSFDDRLRQEESAFHLRRVRSDHSRSPAARHVAIERHNERRSKRFIHSS